MINVLLRLNKPDKPEKLEKPNRPNKVIQRSQRRPVSRDQLISYLKTTDKKLGLVLNFGRSRLEIKRVVNNF